jgi:creatinine amidohydrolase
MSARPFVLFEANYKQLKDYRPNVAVLPWGAAEAHNYHLPHGTDVIEAVGVAERAAELAHANSARPIVLPAVPFGNDMQQLDQVATISISTATASAILSDVVHSLTKQNIDRLVLVNGHGGNEFKPLIRDLQERCGMLIVLINFFQLIPEVLKATFDEPGDHAGEMETSMILHLRPQWVQMEQAGSGRAAAPWRLDAAALVQDPPGHRLRRPVGRDCGKGCSLFRSRVGIGCPSAGGCFRGEEGGIALRVSR